MTTQPIRILLADDHPIVRQGLRQIIETDPAFLVVAEVGDGQAALEQILLLQPDVCIVDVEMPVKDGFELAQTLQRERLEVKLIFLTMYKDAQFFNAALDLQAKGYVVKEVAITEIKDCIKTVAAGGTYISPSVSNLLLDRIAKIGQPVKPEPAAELLTSTERKVLLLIAEYKTSRQIADILCLSIRTVENHRAHIATKLNLKGNHAILQYALAHLDELAKP
ncbi:MAG: response regulator transcription factor [Blastocatellia bacterium]|nr:response regulator transcription factor [Blastocatellia bacterium]